MPVRGWREAYRLGLDVLDGDHHMLFGLLDQLCNAGVGGEPEKLDRLVNAVVNYLSYHFSREELLMERAGYPGLAAHRREHGAALRRAVALQTAHFERWNPAAGSELGETLSGWLRDHILRVDMAYKSYLLAVTMPFDELGRVGWVDRSLASARGGRRGAWPRRLHRML
jgi:hemerythrin-like metal-binding protein